MSDLAVQVVAEARDWIGTPYVHQASAQRRGHRLSGSAARGVARDLRGRARSGARLFGGLVRGRRATSGCGRPRGGIWMPKPTTRIASGDVLLFRMRDGACRQASGDRRRKPVRRPHFIHAYTGHGVIESPLTRALAPAHRGAFCISRRRADWMATIVLSAAGAAVGACRRGHGSGAVDGRDRARGRGDARPGDRPATDGRRVPRRSRPARWTGSA